MFCFIFIKDINGTIRFNICRYSSTNLTIWLLEITMGRHINILIVIKIIIKLELVQKISVVIMKILFILKYELYMIYNNALPLS